jgi:hypothetical protein
MICSGEDESGGVLVESKNLGNCWNSQSKYGFYSQFWRRYNANKKNVIKSQTERFENLKHITKNLSLSKATY